MPSQPSLVAVPLLLLAAAVLAGQWPLVQPAVARGLAQQAPPLTEAAAATAAAAPAAEPAGAVQAQAAGPAQESPYGGPEVDMCVQLTNSAGQACTVESDTLSLVYPRYSEQLPTEEQVAEAISNMKAAAQPAPSCCDGLLPYVQARCPCLPGYQQILPIGGFDPAYFEGATAILAMACRQDFPPCQPGEVSKPSGR